MAFDKQTTEDRGVAPGFNTSDVPRILKETLAVQMQLVEGHKGTAEIALAMEGKEIDGSYWSWLGMKADLPGSVRK